MVRVNSKQGSNPKGFIVYSLSYVQLFVTPWIVAHKAPPSVGFLRQEYWSGLPLPEDLPYAGIETASPAF